MWGNVRKPDCARRDCIAMLSGAVPSPCSRATITKSRLLQKHIGQSGVHRTALLAAFEVFISVVAVVAWSSVAAKMFVTPSKGRTMKLTALRTMSPLALTYVLQGCGTSVPVSADGPAGWWALTCRRAQRDVRGSEENRPNRRWHLCRGRLDDSGMRPPRRSVAVNHPALHTRGRALAEAQETEKMVATPKWRFEYHLSSPFTPALYNICAFPSKCISRVGDAHQRLQ
ncbi:hypothetical protein FB009_1542 [Sinorhizobium medicae]|nr:hypothetical protein FB009_1542 [Sinorhizobium medicae]